MLRKGQKFPPKVYSVLAIYVLLVTLFFLIFNILTNHIASSFFISLASVSTFLFLYFRAPSKKYKYLKVFFDNKVDIIPGNPIHNADWKFLHWAKGFGYIGDRRYSMWTSINEAGVLLFYYSAAVEGVYLIPWFKCQNICYPVEEIKGRGCNSARVFMVGADNDFLVAWDSRLNRIYQEQLGKINK